MRNKPFSPPDENDVTHMILDAIENTNGWDDRVARSFRSNRAEREIPDRQAGPRGRPGRAGSSGRTFFLEAKNQDLAPRRQRRRSHGQACNGRMRRFPRNLGRQDPRPTQGRWGWGGPIDVVLLFEVRLFHESHQQGPRHHLFLRPLRSFAANAQAAKNAA